jgi:hypothetical protein
MRLSAVNNSNGFEKHRDNKAIHLLSLGNHTKKPPHKLKPLPSAKAKLLSGGVIDDDMNLFQF